MEGGGLEGSQAENSTACTSRYPRGLWGLTPVLLRHGRRTRRLQSMVQERVSKQVTAAALVFVCVWESVRHGAQS